MEFDGRAGSHSVLMDAKPPIGSNAGATPKELVGMGLSGCTAMDVIALLKKHKQTPRHLSVDSDISIKPGGYPAVFEKAVLTFKVEGDVHPEVLKEAVALSQTKYCSVSAMLSKAFVIEYSIVLNGQLIGQGTADFESV
jgi:putative redox protein